MRTRFAYEPFILFRQDAGGGGNDSDPVNDSDADPVNDGDPKDGDGKGDDQPAVTFRTQRDFSRRLDREARARLDKQAQELGYKDHAELIDAAKAKRDADDAAKSELDRAKAKADAAEKERDEARALARQRAIAAEAKAVAVDLNVKRDVIPYLLRLADLGAIELDDDGEPDSGAIEAALKAVLDVLPALKADAPASDNDGADKGADGPPPTRKGANGTTVPGATVEARQNAARRQLRSRF